MEKIVKLRNSQAATVEHNIACQMYRHSAPIDFAQAIKLAQEAGQPELAERLAKGEPPAMRSSSSARAMKRSASEDLEVEDGNSIPFATPASFEHAGFSIRALNSQARRRRNR